ncbi:hypothetical protein T07_152, partial [Trichinella nelsoni]
MKINRIKLSLDEIAAFFGNYPLLNISGFRESVKGNMANISQIRNHVDKYVITKHYYQLMPLSLA